MCLSTAFKDGLPESEGKLCEYITEVKIDGDKIVFTDIMGKEVEVSGTIKSMDFVNSKIIVA